MKSKTLYIVIGIVLLFVIIGAMTNWFGLSKSSASSNVSRGVPMCKSECPDGSTSPAYPCTETPPCPISSPSRIASISSVPVMSVNKIASSPTGYQK